MGEKRTGEISESVKTWKKQIWKRHCGKYKAQPKLFYKFINGKIKSKETIERMKGEHGIIEDPKCMVELLNM